jgi:hypothetical protein
MLPVTELGVSPPEKQCKIDVTSHRAWCKSTVLQ